MRIFVAGDTHGDTRWVTEYLYPKAAALDADAILQCGDFGLWEHHPSGVEFLDALVVAAETHNIPLFALRGNHDNYALALRLHPQTTPDGFHILRSGVCLIPDGLVWTWAGTRLRAFGGAYSIDKQWRLDLEAKRNRKERYRDAACDSRDCQFTHRHGVNHTGTLWFPEEQMSDADMDGHLAAYSGPVEIVFSHDKPRATNPGAPFKNEPDCWPNQDRLQRALLAHQPAWWIHGHLHHFYRDTVRCGDDGAVTQVLGLSCDDEAAGRFWKPWHAWCLIDLREGKEPEIILGHIAEDMLDEDGQHCQLAQLDGQAAA